MREFKISDCRLARAIVAAALSQNPDVRGMCDG